MDDTGIDRPSWTLITDLQLEDACEMLKEHKGALALKFHIRNLQSTQASLKYENRARSIGAAKGLDADTIRALTLQEEQAAADRELAIQLAGGLPAAEGGGSGGGGKGKALFDMADSLDPFCGWGEGNYCPSDSEHHDDDARLLQALVDSTADEVGKMTLKQQKAASHHHVHAESSAQGAARGSSGNKSSSTRHWSTRTRSHSTRNCTACADDVPSDDAVRCPCDHDYCRDCVAALFPARCCRQPIPLGLNQIFLPSKLVGQYRAKEIEYAAPNRTYCHQSSCSTFIQA